MHLAALPLYCDTAHKKMSESSTPIDNIILIGTGHVLEKSVKEVEEVIARENPAVVAVELCEARYDALTSEKREFSVKDALTTGNPFLMLTHWLLAYMQRKIGAELGIEPGADMMAAIEKAKEFGCEIALIDRPIQITMQRFWNNMRFWEKLKMLFAIIFSIVSIGRGCGLGRGRGCNETGKVIGEKGKENREFMTEVMVGDKKIELDRLTDEDVVMQLVKELREFSPGAAISLIDERDAYIARNLLMLSQQTFGKSLMKNAAAKWYQTTPYESERRKIVAVVGAGHVAGIKNFLSHPELLPSQDELCSLPKRRGLLNISLGKLLAIGIGATFLLFILALILSGINIPYHLLFTAFLWWFIINGVLSAVGVLIARGHPLSALTAFCVAWLTSLIPFLAAGWFAGLAEAYLRKPSFDDVKNMQAAESVRELMSNRLFKVFLVAGLANIGSTAGTFIGAYVVWQVIGIDMYQIWVGLKTLFEIVSL